VSIEETLAGKLETRTQIVSAFADDWPNVVIGGVQQFAYWCDHVYVLKGEAIMVSREIDASGGTRNTVVGRLGRPGADTGTVLTVETNYLLVSVGATEVRARFDPDKTFTPGDVVALDWKGATITALFVVTDYVPPPAVSTGTTAPPPASSSGTLAAYATDSATWVPGLSAWNAWARGGQNVYQGSYGGYSMFGAWFYNGATKQLDGATITRVQFNVPKRLTVGSYNSAGALHLYTHNADNRPGGDVTRVSGPFDIPLQPGSQGGWVDLPTVVGDTLKTGGGIAVMGDPYMGVVGKAEDPTSGQLLIQWNR
jgi:hypothetical protein